MITRPVARGALLTAAFLALASHGCGDPDSPSGLDGAPGWDAPGPDAPGQGALPARELPELSCDLAGAPCGGGCVGVYEVCATDAFGRSYCSRACETDRDCPTSLKVCATDPAGGRTCQRKTDTSYAACGASTSGELGAACAGGSCAANAVATVCAPPDNPLGAAFCTLPCERPEECGPGASCSALPGLTGAHCVPAVCACAATDADPRTALVGEALAGVPRSTCELTHTMNALSSIYSDALAFDALRLRLFNRLYYAPMAIPHFVDELAAGVAAAPANGRPVSALLERAAELWDAPVGPPTIAPIAPARSFEDVVLAFHAPLDAEAAARKRAQIVEEARGLPPELKERLAPILEAALVAVDLRTLAFGCAGGDAELERYFANTLDMFYRKPAAAVVGAPIDLSTAADRDFFLDHVRYPLLAEAAVLLARAVEDSGLATFTTTAQFSFEHLTPLGQIVVRDGRGDVYLDSGDAILLLLDVGGDDLYQVSAGGTVSIANPVSIAIDLGGDDRYAYFPVPHYLDGARLPSDTAGRDRSSTPVSLSEVSRQGAGNLGIGMLYDLGAGADTYESLRFSQGSGLLGVGVLYDDGGADRYRAEAGSQGASHFGMGLLVDRAGDDRYEGYYGMQGSSFVRGVGLLVDLDGADEYVVQTGDAYVSDDLPGDDPLYAFGNNQGAAWGRRGDLPSDGIANNVHSSGGVGALLDLAGDDRYTCGSFCQGSGYWFGVGLLYDGAGRDAFDARVYGAGAAAHMGVGVFHDGGGDDLYNTRNPNNGLAIGFAHDFSFAWHEDLGGNDTYRGGWASLGEGANQSFGVLLNLGGDDAYESSFYTGFGSVNGQPRTESDARFRQRGGGVFVDHEGQDTYARPTVLLDPEIVGVADTVWIQPQFESYTGEDGSHQARVRPNPMPAAFCAGMDSSP